MTNIMKLKKAKLHAKQYHTQLKILQVLVHSNIMHLEEIKIMQPKVYLLHVKQHYGNEEFCISWTATLCIWGVCAYIQQCYATEEIYVICVQQHYTMGAYMHINIMQRKDVWVTKYSDIMLLKEFVLHHTYQ